MREIRRILKEETAIPENIDKAMEDVLSGILNSPDEKTTGALNKIHDFSNIHSHLISVHLVFVPESEVHYW